MNVKFISKIDGVVVVNCPSIGPKHVIRFRNSYSTTNKKEIRKLLESNFARQKCELAPGQDKKRISDYLEDDSKVDVLTDEYMDDIPDGAWEEIMKYHNGVDVDYPLIGIAKTQLKGKPLTTDIENIVNRHKKKQALKKEEEKTEDPQKSEDEIKDVLTEKEKTSDTSDEEQQDTSDEKEGFKLDVSNGESEKEENGLGTSKDYKVAEALPIIRNKPAEELEGFLDPEEDRSTITDAWKDRFESVEA